MTRIVQIGENIYLYRGVDYVGRYVGKIIHHFSEDKNQPKFQETVFEAQEIFLRSQLEKMSKEQRNQFIETGKREGYFI